MEKLIAAAKGGVGATVKLVSRLEAKKSVREGFLSRGKEYSAITLPYMLPEVSTGDRGGDANAHGYSGFGAQALNHLSNRIVHNLFPANQPFFRLQWTEEEREQLAEEGYMPDELSHLLESASKRVHDYETKTSGRVCMVNVIKHLIISGNACLFIPPSGKDIQCLPLSHYTVTRDSSDEILEIFTESKKAFNTFSETHQALIKKTPAGNQIKAEDEIVLVTWAVRVENDRFMIVQTAEDIQLSLPQYVKAQDLPWIPLRWNTAYMESYGRGLVEDQINDFRVLEFLSEAQMKGLVLISDIKYLVKAGAVTDIDELANAPSGEYIVGNRDDVGILQLERYADFTPITAAIKDIERRLGQVFLMQSAVRRDAERVTAYELRLDAQELNESLGGIYSHLANTLQMPYAYLLLQRSKFPLGRDAVQPRISTGMEALAEAGELDKLRQFSEAVGMMATWPQDLLERVKTYEFALRIASSVSLDSSFLRTNEEQAEVNEANKAQQQEAMVTQEASKAIPNVLENAAQQQMGGQ